MNWVDVPVKDTVLWATGSQAGTGRASRRSRRGLGGLPCLHATPCNSEYSGHGGQRGGFVVSLLYVLIYSSAVS